MSGERLVVSIGSKSSPPVSVDETDLDCDKTQDFCFVRIPLDAVSREVTGFYQVDCHVPTRGHALMAAGFFAGSKMHSGVVTPRGEVIGSVIEGGLVPTNILLEPGMSGGPVFDSKMSVVGIVKGGSTKFGYVQPLQRAVPALLARGIQCSVEAKNADTSKTSEEVLRERQNAIEACVTSETVSRKLSQDFQVNGSVRCPGGGCSPFSRNCNRRDSWVSFSAPGNQVIESYSVAAGAMNDGNLGNLEVYQRDVDGMATAVRARIWCDPSDRPGAGGGWAEATLSGLLRPRDYYAQTTDIKNYCSGLQP